MPTFPRQLSGTCRDGAERDRGRLWHALAADSEAALGEPCYAPAVCGAAPGLRRSAGWLAPVAGTSPAVTCPKCLKKLAPTPDPKETP